MNDTTWVKLYRKSLSNDVRRHDPTAWRLFETLLLLVDSRTGKWAGGRYQLVEADGYLNGSTIYKALQRLEQLGMISLKSNTRFTEIYICKFGEYAKSGNTSSNNEVTTDEQQSNTSSNTLTRRKNIRIKNNTVSDEFNAVYLQLNSFWSAKIGRKLSDTKSARESLRKLLKNHTPEEIQYAINGAVYFQGKQYKPQVMSFSSLYEKWDSLLGHMATVKQQGASNESNRF